MKVDTKLTIGWYLRYLRESQSLTLRDVEEITGISHSHLSKIERDEYEPTDDMIFKLAKPLGVDSDELLIARNNEGRNQDFWRRELVNYLRTLENEQQDEYIINGKYLNIFKFNYYVVAGKLKLNQYESSRKKVNDILDVFDRLERKGYSIEDVESILNKYDKIKEIVNN